MKARDIKQKGITINLDKERHLVFDLNAFCELEDKFGTINKAFDALQEEGSMKPIRYLLYVGLLHEDETLTEKMVGSLITLQNIGEIMQKVTEAIADAMPEVETGKN